MNTTYQDIIAKLNELRKKYYLNQFLKGFIFLLIVYPSVFLLMVIIEYFFYLSVNIKTVLFIFNILLILFLIYDFCFIPVSKFYGFGKLLSFRTINNIVLNKFSEIDDKLINIIELNEKKVEFLSSDLVLASIDQKISTIKHIPFSDSINLKSNYKYAKYLTLLFFLFLSLLIFKPDLLNFGTKRLVNFSQHYQKPIPFSFVILNSDLITEQNSDFELLVKVEGKYIPSELFITYEGQNFLMQKEKDKKNLFSHIFRNVKSNYEFNFEADQFESEFFNLNCYPSSVLEELLFILEFPKYVGEENREVKNISDLIIPSGTNIRINIISKNIDSLFLKSDNQRILFENSSKNQFTYQFVPTRSNRFVFLSSNQFEINKNLFNLNVTVIPDLFPSIDVQNSTDSAFFTETLFTGSISDDYAVSKLVFNYSINDENSTTDLFQKISLPIGLNRKIQDFNYKFDFSLLLNNNNQFVKYYFEVFDNDIISGYKSTKSSVFEYRPLSVQQILELQNNKSESLESKFSLSKSLVNSIQSDLNKFQNLNSTQTLTPFEKNQMIQAILDKQNQLENLMKEIQDEHKEKNKLENSLNKDEAELLEKQKQLQELLDQLMTDDIKQLMKELQKLQNEYKPQNVNQLTKDLQKNLNDLQKQLDKDLELLKRYDVETKVQNNVDLLKELADKLNSDADKLNQKKNMDSIQKLGDNREKEFNDIMENYKKNIEQNNELKDPLKLNDFNQEKEDIKSTFDKIDKSPNRSKKSEQNFKDAGKQTNELAEKMQEMLDKNTNEDAGENEDDMRQIMDNLLRFSFEQEHLMNEFKSVSKNDPKFAELSSNQKNISDDFIHIKDSLDMLSKRTPQVSVPINKEVNQILRSLEKLADDTKKKNLNSILINQQFAMTSANNLALLLSESLDNMQNQSKGSQQSNKKSNKKGKGKPSIGDLKTYQKQMKDQLEKMMEQMKNSNPNGQSPQLNQDFVKALSQQEMFQKMLNDIINKTSLNPEIQKQLNDINKLIEDNKADLVNKQLNNESLLRNQKILTRLLEAENAQKEQENDNKRESKEGDEKYKTTPNFIQNLNKSFFNLNQDLDLSILRLNNFYKLKFDSYIKTLK